jgi:flavin-binding protein dodecin
MMIIKLHYVSCKDRGNRWSSNKSWDDAAQKAVNEAVKTIPEIHGIEIKDMTAMIDQSTGND